MTALAILLALAVPAAAGKGPDFNDRPGVGHPLRFTDGAGHVFQPSRLVVLTDAGIFGTRFPDAVNDARSEEHVDLSGSPAFGKYFRRRLAPVDAARDGLPVGPLYRVGGTLVLDARGTALPLQRLALVLTAEFPRDGAVSYRLGRPGFAAATMPGRAGVPAGGAYLLDGALVLTGAGRGQMITDWGKVRRPSR